MRRIFDRGALASLLAGLLLAGCGTMGLPDIDDDDRADQPVVQDVRGTVRAVDARDCVIEVTNARYDTRLSDDDFYGGERTLVYCNADTVVYYQGRTYRPAALEPGDRIVARVDQVGGRLVAERIDVTYDVSANDRRDDVVGGRYGLGDVRGTVVQVDRTARTVELEDVEFDPDVEGIRGDRAVIDYDADTVVELEGRRYRPENLEPGDRVAVEVDEVRGRLLAEEIEVLSDVRAGASR